MFGNIRNIHFIGIGGVGMSGIAHVLIDLGYQVSGSDLADNNFTKKLKKLGATIFNTHQESNVHDAHVIVVSSAIPDKNPEIIYGKQAGIHIIHRSEMLAELIRLKYAILIAGTHGKTTTTSIIANILNAGNYDPSVVIGGQFNNIDSSAKNGEGEFIVCEADESDGSFIKLNPTIAIVSNIEQDHMDHYEDFDHLQNTFLDFINKIPFYGCAIINIDDQATQNIIPKIEKNYITFGTSNAADFRFQLLEEKDGSCVFKLWEKGEAQGEFTINLPGVYNVYNTVSAIATARFLNVSYKDISSALNVHAGIVHRFTTIGKVNDIVFIDDYAHNPTKISSVLKAAQNGWNRRIIAVFQPHRYSRVQYCFDEFVRSFYDADMVFVTPIYEAGEDPIPGITSETLTEGILKYGHKAAKHIENRDALVKELIDTIKPGDMVITLGAGDIWRVGETIVNQLQSS